MWLFQFFSQIKRLIKASGYEQHDTEEFLSFLLSCLHDDLNRVKGRPPVRDIDDKQPDEKLAEDVWAEEKRRNDSVVDDLFKGNCFFFC